MPLKDWAEVGPEDLKFPIAGTVYRAAELTAARGLELVRISEGDESDLSLVKHPFNPFMLGCSDECMGTHKDPAAERCGSVYDQMLAGGAPAAAIERAAQTVYLDWRLDRAAAIKFWETGPNPEAAAASTAATSTTPPSTPPVEATTTPTPVSGTTTKPARKRTAKKTANRSRSPRSSATST